jgi:type IV pilus assembly protein PilN
MKFAINLARRPAENLRRIWVIWGGLLAICFALLLLLLTAVSAGVYVRVGADNEIANIKRDMGPLGGAEARYVKLTNERGEKADIARAVFLNRLIDQKAISWTHLFERLEAIMPAQVQLVTLRPASQRGQSEVTMLISAANLDRVTAFVRRLESAPDFARPTVEQYSRSDQQTEERVLLQVTAHYNPQAFVAGNLAKAEGEQHVNGERAENDEAPAVEGDQSSSDPGDDSSAPPSTANASPEGRRK